MEKCHKKGKMMKKGQILLKKAELDEQWEMNIFWIFSGKYGKMSQKVKNDEKGSDIAEKGLNWWKMKKIIFVGFFQFQYGTMSKKVKNDEKGSYIAERA